MRSDSDVPVHTVASTWSLEFRRVGFKKGFKFQTETETETGVGQMGVCGGGETRNARVELEIDSSACEVLDSILFPHSIC